MTNIINNINKIKIINVGQGDSFILTPCDNCKYKNKNIFIDVGDGKKDVFKYKTSNELILSLSHSHKDHIGGLHHFFNKYPKLLNEIWLPMYYDEICIITSFILKLKDIQSISNDNGNFIKAKNVVFTSYLIDSLKKLCSKPIEIKELYEGKNLCRKHIKVFNPPFNPESILGVNNVELTKYISQQKQEYFPDFRGWFHKNHFHELLRILSEELDENPNDFDESIPNDTIPLLIEQNESNNENRRRFIYGMFFILKKPIAAFAEKPNNTNFNKIYDKVKLTSNNASIVFKYVDGNLDILFTGDAGKEVFERLMESKCKYLKSKILKIPHHGSRKNINKKILRHIKPSYAIISHGNGKFGKQRDPHPNKRVIKMLDDLNIKTIYTNDVIKQKTVTRNKPDKSFVNSYLDYIDDE